MYYLRIFLGDPNNLHATFQRGPLADTETWRFETIVQALEHFKDSEHNIVIVYTDPVADQGEAYKLLKAFEGQFFSMYAWGGYGLVNRGWVSRLITVEWAIIQSFFGI